MSFLPRQLSNKLVLSLFLLLLLASTGIIGFTVLNAPRFLQELNQGLNRELAANIVKEKPLMLAGGVNEQALQSVFMGLMLVNPAIEVYLVDSDGKLLAYSAPEGAVKRQRVALAPIKRFLAAPGGGPVLGTDPRDPAHDKVFSTAAIRSHGRLQGYLYIVLAGQAYESVLGMLQSSYMLKLWVLGVLLSMLIALLAGALLVRHITGRLSQLSTAMLLFRESDFQQRLKLPWRYGGSGDEIDQLGARFCELSTRIMQQLQQLRHNDTTRRELVANVSHDLRTPMASLQGYLETLELKAEALDDEERRQYIRIAYQHSERLQRLISELFELSTLESSDQALTLEPFSLSELAQDVGQKFRLMAEHKGIHLAMHIPRQSALVRADIGLIQRALDNLIDNAIKYTPRGGRVDVHMEIENRVITTRISDNGPGIEAAEIPRIFERFYRVDKHRGSEGSGLGLAIAQRILQLHDSCIRVQSRPEQGTTFFFRLQAGGQAQT
jgi:two-component system OmpR family sensor kinase